MTNIFEKYANSFLPGTYKYQNNADKAKEIREKEEGRKKKEEGRRNKEEGRRKKKEGL